MILLAYHLCILCVCVCVHLQENPQGVKRDLEGENAEMNCDARQELGVSPNQRSTEIANSRSQCSSSPVSQEEIESDISDDSDQELDIEDDIDASLNAQIWARTDPGNGRFQPPDNSSSTTYHL